MAIILSDRQIREIEKMKILLEKGGYSYNRLLLGRQYQIAFEKVVKIIIKSEETEVAYN